MEADSVTKASQAKDRNVEFTRNLPVYVRNATGCSAANSLYDRPAGIAELAKTEKNSFSLVISSCVTRVNRELSENSHGLLADAS